MQSISKTVVPEPAARAIVADAFGAGARLRSFEELTEGFFNAAYAIALGDGRRCVLKVAPPPGVPVLRYERDIIHAEVAAMRLVKQRTSMPVPAICWFDASRRRLPSPFYLMEYVEGTPLHKLRDALSIDEQRAIDREAIGYLRQMNEIAADSFGYLAPAAARYPSWPAAFLGMVEGVLRDGEAARVELPRPYDALRELIRERAGVLAQVTAPRLVHWDLWDGNIFVDPATRRIAGVIDFERALWGDPLMEFQFRAPANLPELDDAYGRRMLETGPQRQRRLLYNIYLYLIMVIECTYRQYPTDDQERWAREQLAQDLERLSAER